MDKSFYKAVVFSLAVVALAIIPLGFAAAQDSPDEDTQNDQQEEQPQANISTPSPQTFIGKPVSFDISGSTVPEGADIYEVVWNFGTSVRTTGDAVTHTYQRLGKYTVRVTIDTSAGVAEDTREIQVFKDVAIVITDTTDVPEAVQLAKQQAAENDMLLLSIHPKTEGPEVAIEESLADQVTDARDALLRSDLIMTWTSGSVGVNVLSNLAQHIKQSDELSFQELSIDKKGVIVMSDTPFGVIAPSAQSVFDQLGPAYVLLTRQQAISFFTEPQTPDAAKDAVISSPISHRLLGTFSSRAVQDVSITNFLSFGINYLVNEGVPINSITLILMLPVIATILSFSRQVIGIKAFGIITPAMTTLSFLVLGLENGLIVFSAVLLSGTITRLIIRKLHMLYLPRMALVLTMASFSIIGVFALSAVTDRTSLVSFSIFPILILTLLAEEFIAAQFKSGGKQALTITAWTLALSIISYFVVSWQILRTVIISYPEVVLLAIPINILLGRWSGLRITEYIRFRKLLRYIQ